MMIPFIYRDAIKTAIVLSFIQVGAPLSSVTQASRDILLALGEQHVREHFPTADLLADAIHHQLLRLAQTVEDVSHPFVACTSYYTYSDTIAQLAARYRKRKDVIVDFKPHLTYSSHRDDRVCFITMLWGQSELQIVHAAREAGELVVLAPIPPVLKMDHSIPHAIDWSIRQYSDSQRIRQQQMHAEGLSVDSDEALLDPVTREERRLNVFSHPILKDVQSNSVLELSVIFRPDWSSTSTPASSASASSASSSSHSVSQQQWAEQWMQSLRQPSAGDSAWADLYWTPTPTDGGATAHTDTDSLGSMLRRMYNVTQTRSNSKTAYRGLSAAHRGVLRKHPLYGRIFDRLMALPPYSDEEGGGGTGVDGEAVRLREKWSHLRTLYEIYSQSSSSSAQSTVSSPNVGAAGERGEGEAGVNRSSGMPDASDTPGTRREGADGTSALWQRCGLDGLRVRHRANNVLLRLPAAVFHEASSLSGLCLVHLVSLLLPHAPVSRVALSRPMRLLNNMARPIVQSGTAQQAKSELYSLAGLNGTGVVVGISDTGIDEESCYFYDPQLGRVPRSDIENPKTYPQYRKIVQYVNYSGSGGDYSGGHGSHVSGTVAGHSLGSDGSSYNGMASGAKLAFFDIGSVDSELFVPDDLAKWLFPSAYTAGARLYSNSWGGSFWYDAFCLEVDRFLYEKDDFLVFFAGGNNGGEGYRTILSPSLSKNAVAVAASYNNVNGIGDIPEFSSTGPAPDGRIKPDIVAPGMSISSARAESELGSDPHTCATTVKQGTSMATPVAAGNAALVHQYFHDKHFWAALCNPDYPLCAKGAFHPSGSLVKALLIHSAAPCALYRGGSAVGTHALGSPPDRYQGFGRVLLSNVLPLRPFNSPNVRFALFVDRNVLYPLTQFTYTVTVTATNKYLRATLSWFDPPNTEFASRVLVNDLDLVVTSPSGEVRYGNSLEVGGQRDEINNNEQVTVATDGGLVLGEWTVAVQAKLLPTTLHQAFSLVITATGRVTPPSAGQLPAIISPEVLDEECGASSIAPGSSRSPQAPHLPVDFSLWDMIDSDGWGDRDYLQVSTVDSQGVGRVIAGEKAADEVTAVAEVFQTGFSKYHNAMHSRVGACLPQGCYQASLHMDPSSTQPGSQVSAPACNVFLAPYRPSQVFCTDAPQRRIDPTKSNATTNKVSVGYESAADSCADLCARQEHVTFPIYLYEPLGSGFVGAYYAAHPLIDPYALLVEAQARGPSAVSALAIMLTSRNAVAAGTLEWGFDRYLDLCLPVNTTAVAVVSASTVSTSDAPLDTPLHASSSSDRRPIDPLLAVQPTDTCFSLQMSIPSDIEVYPYLLVEDAWEGSGTAAGAAKVDCPWHFQPNVTYAVLCVAPSFAVATIRFYSTSYTSMGQRPISTVNDAMLAYSAQGMRYLGTCSFALEHHKPSPLPSNVTHPNTPIAAPSRAPLARPSLAPHTTPAPSNHDDEYAVDTGPVKGSALDYYASHNFSCLASCTGYPGLSALQPQMTFGGCLFLLGSVFEVCSSYAIAHGLCAVPSCVKKCSLADFCFFGASAAAYCPDQPWVEAQSNSSLAFRVRRQCESAYASDAVWAPHPPSVNQTDGAVGATDAKNGGMHLALPVTVIVLITAFAMFGALLLLVAVARFKLLRRGRTSAASLFRRATAAATGAHARLNSGDDASSQHGMFMNASTHSTAGSAETAPAARGGMNDRGDTAATPRSVSTPLTRRMRLGLSAALRNVGVSPLSPLSQQEHDDDTSPGSGAATGVVRHTPNPIDKAAASAGAGAMMGDDADDDDDDMQEIELSFTAPRSTGLLK